MWKSVVCFTLLVATANLYAQVPEGYYESAEGLNHDGLKSALYQIIKDHTEYPYTASNTDTWDILKESDKDPNNPDNVILFYTGWSVNAEQEYNSGAGWNREHVWAKSRGDFGTSLGPGTDAHHLRPCDISVNSARNSRWFDNCSTPYFDGGMETGCFTSGSSWTWQPREAVKGDVARMILYMATRYEGENGEPDLEVIDLLPSDRYTKESIHAKLSTLLDWHQEDPVDSFEQNRNEAVYAYQANRNPFIDHPEYVTSIWGEDQSTDIVDQFHSSFRVYPNPVRDVLTIETSILGQYSINISSMKSQRIYSDKLEGSIQQIDLSPFPEGVYFITIRSKDVVTTRKVIKL
jgi:endonuclease I